MYLTLFLPVRSGVLMRDVIFTCEERCFDAACESILNRSRQSNQPVHVINVEIIDNHEQATVGGKLILQLAQEIEATTDLDQEIGALLEAFIDKTKANILYTITYL
ncbi:RNA polymerase II subunit A C-terminal domain phosphatase [Batrachochytrium dendrobatidis]|nr:RNA polymerase II subunit A C-terminal domain phosphatase [Batrachochytrium dendrobatidis]